MNEKMTRRAMVGGAVATAAGITLAPEVEAAYVECNNGEKCEAKCGDEHALCCNGRCISGGCGHDRNLNFRTCRCERRTRRGKVRTTPPKYCGA